MEYVYLVYIEQRMLKKENERGRVEGGEMMPGIESRNESRDANGIDVVVNESSQWSR